MRKHLLVILITGLTSWYGLQFHGKTMANGQVFDMYDMTAAHPYYAFGMKLKVTDMKTKKYVFVVVTDRGPYIEGRTLDLSMGAASLLGILDRGVVKVEIEKLK